MRIALAEIDFETEHRDCATADACCVGVQDCTDTRDRVVQRMTRSMRRIATEAASETVAADATNLANAHEAHVDVDCAAGAAVVVVDSV